MCLAIPGQVEQLFDDAGVKMARVNFAGIKKSVCIEYTPEVSIGNYVLVHVGFAISVIDEQEARRSFDLLKDMNQLTDLDVLPDSDEQTI